MKGGSVDRATYMCIADALQKQLYNLCLAVKLRLGQSELMLSLKQQQELVRNFLLTSLAISLLFWCQV